MKEIEYYTPSIDEFYIGFECEFKNDMQDNEWKREVVDADTMGIALSSNEHRELGKEFRVQYLSRTDIEQLGWKFKGRALSDFYEIIGYQSPEWLQGHKITKLKLTYCWRYETYKWVKIEAIIDSQEETLFEGEINNKSELKRLMERHLKVKS